MGAIAGHLLGDILLQNRWLARAKRDRWWGMMLHCLIVTVSTCLLANWWDIRAVAVFLAHMAIDRWGIGKTIWPELLDQGNPNDNEPAPLWLRLLDDQSLHIVSLALIDSYIGK